MYFPPLLFRKARGEEIKIKLLSKRGKKKKQRKKKKRKEKGHCINTHVRHLTLSTKANYRDVSYKSAGIQKKGLEAFRHFLNNGLTL